MFMRFVAWARAKFGNGVVRCCPSLKKLASMAQDVRVKTSVWQFSPPGWKPVPVFNLVFSESWPMRIGGENCHENRLVKTA